MGYRYLKLWGGHSRRFLFLELLNSVTNQAQGLEHPFILGLSGFRGGDPVHKLVGLLCQAVGANPNRELATWIRVPTCLEQAFLASLPSPVKTGDGLQARDPRTGQPPRQDLWVPVPHGGMVRTSIRFSVTQHALPSITVTLEIPKPVRARSSSISIRLQNPWFSGSHSELGRWAMECLQYFLDWVPVLLALSRTNHRGSEVLGMTRPDWDSLDRQGRLLWMLRSPVPPLVLRGVNGELQIEPRWSCPRCRPLGGPGLSPGGLLQHFRSGRHLAYITRMPRDYVLAQVQMAEITDRFMGEE